MTIDDLIRERGAWLSGDGELGDVVISSRIRLARNLKGMSFRNRASPSDLEEIHGIVVDACMGGEWGSGLMQIRIPDLGDLDRQVLVERHLISRQLADAEGMRGVLLSPAEDVAIMINEEDHLRIQTMSGGMALGEVWERIDALDDALNDEIEFAFDETLGYLTACPTNVGTGIRVSVMLHLPALRMTGEIQRVILAAAELKLAIRGLYGEGTESWGDFFQISNQVTLGKSEKDFVTEFSERIIPEIVRYERKAREAMLEQRTAVLEDRVGRAYGALRNARIISYEETLHHLSHLRLAVHTGRFDKFGVNEINDLLMPTQPAHLQKLKGRMMEEEPRRMARAEFLREKLHELDPRN